MTENSWIIPGWSAPPGIRAITTTRSGGVSSGEFASMNPAMHVNDDRDIVLQNRMILKQKLNIDTDPCWLEQVHSTEIIDLEQYKPGLPADGSTSDEPGKVCAVLTADCLPVLLVDRLGRRVAALHAGWRGLADGILEKGVRLYAPDEEVMAWMGPAIGPDRFEVGEEVIEQLMLPEIRTDDWCRPSGKPGKWLVDLYQNARFRLLASGAAEVTGGGYCTFSDAQRFYSYRRQGQCGRMATLIWIDRPADDVQT